MKDRDRERAIRYATELAVLVQGCNAQGCEFAPDDDNRIAAAVVCRCRELARERVNALWALAWARKMPEGMSE